ncbi:MFS transporter [Brachybacterium tyrofermentans]|uniref:MFS transporter n=1 Tax=Brachybacterium tyrofermentans TaxID=47848 RepID=UPI003FD01F05
MPHRPRTRAADPAAVDGDVVGDAARSAQGDIAGAAPGDLAGAAPGDLAITPGADGGPQRAAIRDRAAIQRRTLHTLILMQVIGTIGVGVAPSIGVLLAGEVTQNEAWAGLARTASTLGAALLGLPLGNLAARYGRRVALATGWWTAAAGGALLVVAAQASLVVPLFVGLLLIGAGSAVSLQARFAATDLAAPAQRARALSMVVWVGMLGSVLGPNLGIPGQWIGDRIGLNVYAASFLIAAVALAAAGLVVVVRLRPDPLLLLEADAPDPQAVAMARGVGPRTGRTRLMLAELRTNAPARFAVVGLLTAQIVMVSVMTMTPVHLAGHGDSIAVIGLTISLHVVGMFALAPVVGLLADRRGVRFTIVVGILVLLVSLLIGILRPDATGWVIASLILLGLGWSFVNVSASALFSTVVPPTVRASAQGGVDALANLCGATAAFLAGPLLVATSFATLSALAIVVLIPLTVMVVGPARLRGAAPVG